MDILERITNKFIINDCHYAYGFDSIYFTYKEPNTIINTTVITCDIFILSTFIKNVNNLIFQQESITNTKKKSRIHIVTDDLISTIDNDLGVAISTNNYKLSYIIITSVLDVILYGINQYDFVNEKDTISFLFDSLCTHLIQLQMNASVSYYSSYLYE